MGETYQGVKMQRRVAMMTIAAMAVAGLQMTAPASAGAARSTTPADPLAGGPATALHRNLASTQQPGLLNGFLFGQQHANWDSKRYRAVDDAVMDWRGPRIQIGGFDGFVSDIELATTLLPGVDSRRPAVYGFNLRTALKLTADDRVAYADRIVEAYKSGGVVTIHFPADNPATGAGHKDITANALCLLSTDWSNPPTEAAGAVAQWQGELAEAAEFFRLVNDRWRDPDADGVDERAGRVAMVFRPFHEMLRIQHWWSAAYYRSVPGVCEGSAASAFRSLWRQTFDYVVGSEELDVHGLLFAWSPDRPTAAPGWEGFYPNAELDRESTADYVDIIAFDVYESTPAAFSRQLVADASAVTSFNASLAPEDREVVAIGEFGPASGLSTMSDGNWFIEAVVRPLTAAGLADEIAYAMTWSNMDEDRYWVPLPCFNVGDCEAFDTSDVFYGSSDGLTGDPIRGFRAFVNHPSTVFLEDLPAWWRFPDATIPFQAGESPRPLLRVPCWTGYDASRPDLLQRLESCPVTRFIGRPSAVWH